MAAKVIRFCTDIGPPMSPAAASGLVAVGSDCVPKAEKIEAIIF